MGTTDVVQVMPDNIGHTMTINSEQEGDEFFSSLVVGLGKVFVDVVGEGHDEGRLRTVR
jgi:hypothetical protein